MRFLLAYLPFGKNTNTSSSFLHWRFTLVFFLIMGSMCLLILRAFYLQIVETRPKVPADPTTQQEKNLLEKANDLSLRTEKIDFNRGKILDRNGRILAISIPMHTINFDPKAYFDHQLKRDKDRWTKLAEELDMSGSDMEKKVRLFTEQKGNLYEPADIFEIKSDRYWQLLAKITEIDYTTLNQKVRQNPNSVFVALEHAAIGFETQKMQSMAKYLGVDYQQMMKSIYKNPRSRFLTLSRHREEYIATYIRSLNIAGIVVRIEPRSFYPLGEAAAQLIGYTNIDGVGRSKEGQANSGAGLEYSLDPYLTGKSGERKYRKDLNGNIIEIIHEQHVYNPQDIVLSIDEELQTFAFNTIKQAVKKQNAESGTAVLVDIRTGEILAMVNAPSFNPNDPLRKDFASPAARNRAISDTFEPASTVKPFTIFTALHNGVTYPSEVIDTRSLVLNNHSITDVAKRDSLTLTGILQKSSNIGVAKLALRLPSIQQLIDTYDKIGFGKPVNLGLPGEARGTNGNRQNWSDIEKATLSYGYGLTVTPVQLARAYATLGSFGHYRPLSITKVDPIVAIGDSQPVLAEKIVRDVVHMMESVSSPGEGGQHAAVEGYRVAVKTGTAKKVAVKNTTGNKKEKAEYVERYIAYTAGVAPVSDPRYALVVLIDDPKAGDYYGGRISAPLFSSIMGYTLKAKNIKPDNLPKEN